MHQFNHLHECSSPYLQQHAKNPVHWFPWCEEAFALAAEKDQPVFLSIGYSSCHWCHVMAHESFESETVAAVLNSHFVSVKVDREERPDLDELYMTAVQLATGRGGWPMTLFLLPNRVPFFAGTYFPPQSRQGTPGFMDICQQIALLWSERRDQLLEAASQFESSLKRATDMHAPESAPPMNLESIRALIGDLWSKFDAENGGFGGAPKFPPHSALRLLGEPWLSDTHAPTMLVHTLDRMAQGGIHDAVGGGFHRYSTDQFWHLPHFEKMLADNAQMLTVLAGSVGPTQSKLNWVWAAARLVEWAERDLLLPNGMFASALDADSDGAEGSTYVWTLDEVQQILSNRSAAFCEHYAVLEAGNYREEATQELNGTNVLHGVTAEHARFESELNALRDHRAGRPRPFLDHKAVAAWNGLMIEGLCRANRLDLATTCALAWQKHFAANGYLPHMVTDDVASEPGFLDDSVWMAIGILELNDALALRGETQPVLVEFAENLVTEILGSFFEPNNELPRYRRACHEPLFAEVRPMFDQVLPCPMSGLIEVFRQSGRFAEASALASTMWRFAASVPTASEGALWAIGRLLQDPSVTTAETKLHATETTAGHWRIELPTTFACNELHARVGLESGVVMPAVAKFESGAWRITWQSDQPVQKLMLQVCREGACEPWKCYEVDAGR